MLVRDVVSPFSSHHIIVYAHNLRRRYVMGKSRRARGHGRQSRVAAKRARKTDDGPSLQQDAEDIEFELMDRVYAFTGMSFLSLHHHVTH